MSTGGSSRPLLPLRFDVAQTSSLVLPHDAALALPAPPITPPLTRRRLALQDRRALPRHRAGRGPRAGRVPPCGASVPPHVRVVGTVRTLPAKFVVPDDGVLASPLIAFDRPLFYARPPAVRFEPMKKRRVRQPYSGVTC